MLKPCCLKYWIQRWEEYIITNKNNRLHIYTERHILRNPGLTVLMKISIDGHFDESRFEAALLTLKNVHPLLYSTVVIDDDGEAYYRENAVQRLELHCAKRERRNQWLEVAETENRRPFNCEKGPLARFFVFYGEADFDILAVVQHLVGDGNAIARLLRDVVTAYAGIDLPRQEQTLISSPDDLPHGAAPSFSVKMLSRSLNTIWKKCEQPCFAEREAQEMFYNYHQQTDIGLANITLNASDLNNLHRACKKNDVTVNSAIIAALIKAVQEEHYPGKNKKAVVGIPINMRKQLSLPVDNCLGNFASAVTVRDRYNTRKNFWENAARMQSKLQSKLKLAKASWVSVNFYTLLNPSLVDAMYFAAYGQCDDKAAKKAASMLSIDNPSSMAISNLGRLDFDCRIGSYRIRNLVFFAPKAPVSYIVLGVATLGDTMQIGISYDRKIISADTMSEITSKMLESLKLPDK